MSVAKQVMLRWQADPVAFAYEVLGLDLLEAQRDVLRSVASNRKTAVKSGHKTGKTTTAAACAIWHGVCFDRARSILTASSARQVDSLLWYEVQRLYRTAKIPIGGHMHLSAAGGLKLSRDRQIFGFATDETEKMAGFSSPKMLFVIDEASGFDRKIYEAIEGNCMGGASILAISNPTKTYGFFFDAFHKESSSWSTHTLNSLEIARTAQQKFDGKTTGLADLASCEASIALWGKDSPKAKVRIFGEFAADTSDAFINPDAVLDAMRAHPHTRGSGRLTLGVDVARFGKDNSAIAARRGQKIAYVKKYHHLDGPKILEEVLDTIKRLKKPDDEKPLVILDVTGIGQGSAGWYREKCEIFDLIEVNSGRDKLTSDDTKYANVRADAWDCFREWIERGGAIPNDDDLRTELVAPKSDTDKNGRLIIESKRSIRSRLGKSTDLADACVLSTYERGNIIE